MTKRQDLCLQRRSRSEQSDRRQPNQAANISHQPRASPDSTALTSRIEFPTMTGSVLDRERAFNLSISSSVIVNSITRRHPAMIPLLVSSIANEESATKPLVP